MMKKAFKRFSQGQNKKLTKQGKEREEQRQLELIRERKKTTILLQSVLIFPRGTTFNIKTSLVKGSSAS